MEEPKQEAPPPTPTAKARPQIGPSIDKLLAIPPNLDGLTPLQAADCFLKSEEFFVERALRVASEMETRLKYHIKLHKTVLTEQEIAPLFLNLTQIYAFNRKLYTELLKLRLHSDIVAEVGMCMVRHIPFFKLYAGYIKEYRKSQILHDLLVEKKKKFCEWLDLNELCAGYSLKQLLLAPVSRLPQYLIFLSAIVRSLDPESESAQRLLNAVNAVSQVTDDISQFLKDEVSRKLVVTVQQRIFGNHVSLIAAHRFVIKHSDLKKMHSSSFFSGSNKIYLFVLFSDCLVYGTRPGRLTSGVLKHVLPLIGMRVELEPDDSKGKVRNAFKIHSNLKSFVVCAQNGPMRQSWMQALNEAINAANTAASSLHKDEQMSAEEFEAKIKMKPQKAEQEAALAKAAAQAQAQAQAIGQQPASGSSSSSSTALTHQQSYSQSSSQSQSQSISSPSGPPPPPRPSAAPSAPPMSPPAPPPRSHVPAAAPDAPPMAPPMAPPPVPPAYGSGDSGHDGAYNTSGEGDQETGYGDGETDDGESGGYNVNEIEIPAAPVLEYDIPSAPPMAPSMPPPPAPPMAPSIPPPPAPPAAPSAPVAPAPSASPNRSALLSQIQAGTQLRSTSQANIPWQQVLDLSSGQYYYQHKVTGETTWDQPDKFIPHSTSATPGGGGGRAHSGSIIKPEMEQKLKLTLERYRQFVQDDEDDVGECGADEWD